MDMSEYGIEFKMLTVVASRFFAVFFLLGLLHWAFMVAAAVVVVLYVLAIGHKCLEWLIDTYFNWKGKNR